MWRSNVRELFAQTMMRPNLIFFRLSLYVDGKTSRLLESPPVTRPA